ncbi:MAG: UDP-N-acetylglucosamine 2-epimerase (non-hydrolyzing) [Actinomycetota bacterium]|nr:UDP-N-acetylglucosamine 2-epimerase (non-hydrolyzing) [Actinomycetota bacterium]
MSIDLPADSIAVVLGTRPEAIKLAGIVELLGPAAWVVHSGQHYDAGLAADVLVSLGFPAADVQLSSGGASRGTQVGHAVIHLDELFARHRPRVVVVQGDTNTVLAGGLAASSAGVPLVHVEAGLRSRDRDMPEETNRVVADHLADLCCAPTTVNVANLAAEGITGDRVALTGNTVVESVLRLVPARAERTAILAAMDLRANGFVLATVHRPENVDRPGPLAAVLTELGNLPLPVVLPIHPRTASRIDQFGMSTLLEPIRVVPPLTPRQFLGLAAETALLVSDSGGIQEEASVLKRPVLVVRRSTERPEVQGTFAELVDPGPAIGERARAWLSDPTRLAAITGLPSPYGDGSASTRIVALLRERWGG